MPTDNFAAADLVLGQAGLTETTANRGGVADAQTLSSPSGIAVAGNRMLIVDAGNNRVLGFDAVPSINGSSANLVLGQATMSDTAANRGGAVAANAVSGPADVWTDGVRVAVVDGNSNRVLLWNTFPTSNGQAPDLVLGQQDFTSALANLGQPMPVRVD